MLNIFVVAPIQCKFTILWYWNSIFYPEWTNLFGGAMDIWHLYKLAMFTCLLQFDNAKEKYPEDMKRGAQELLETGDLWKRLQLWGSWSRLCTIPPSQGEGLTISPLSCCLDGDSAPIQLENFLKANSHLETQKAQTFGNVIIQDCRPLNRMVTN